MNEQSKSLQEIVQVSEGELEIAESVVSPAEASSVTAGEVAEQPEDLATVQQQRDEYYDRLLRKTAEFDNYRKRIERERQEFRELATADLLKDLLALVDDFERALQAEVTADSVAAYRAGVELIHKQLLEVLSKRGVVRLESVGKPFDPHVHQAVAREVTTEYPEGHVIAEFRRGYMIGERLLRAAMVKVASP